MRFDSLQPTGRRLRTALLATAMFLVVCLAPALAANDNLIIINYGPLTALNVTITGATLGTTSTVNFKVADQSGNAFVGLTVDTLEIMLAQLQPGHDGNPPAWQSYINTVQVPAPGVGIGTQNTVVGARDAGGKLVDNHDGTYVYTLGTNVTAVTSPVAVPFLPALTHRVALAIRSSTLPQANNSTYTWQPSTGATTGILTRDVASTDSCNTCHSHLTAHGGPRQDVKLCVTCHNPGSIDSESLNSLDFEVMIHKIHRGIDLPSVQSGKPYIIYGRNGAPNDFSDVVFPQNIRNCTKCHDPANPATPDAHVTNDQPTIQACGACHDDINFATGAGHAGGASDNSQCTICHKAGGFAGSVPDSHVVPAKVAALAFKYNIISVTNSSPGSKPTIVFSVTNPQNGNKPYDLKADPAFKGSNASLSIDLAWSTFDYGNADSGTNPGQPIKFSILASAAPVGDGTFKVTSPTAIPVTATGSGGVAIEGHPAGDFNGDGVYSDNVPVTSAVSYFAITDSSPQPRRTVVPIANCQNCHGQNDGLAFHGSNRTDNVGLCVMCHNPNFTDVGTRPIDPDGTPNGVNNAAVDKLEQRALNFNTLIHSLHGAGFRTTKYIMYGRNSAVQDFSDVRYPGILQNCNQCHSDGTEQVPLTWGLLGTTVDTHATQVAPNADEDTAQPVSALANSAAYSRITPTAAACAGCHDDIYSKAHMEQNGASFYIIQSLIGSNSDTTESCPVCHKPGALADIDVVHGIQ